MHKMALQVSPEPGAQDVRRLTATINDVTARIAADHFDSALRAVVLTGSLARDEGSFVREGTCWKLLGDADFFLVFHKGKPLPASLNVDSIQGKIRSALEDLGIEATVGLGIVYGSHFLNLPLHIATYELRSCGRVVWGESDILSLVPVFGPSKISLEDAWRMLANRIIELLEVVAAAPEADTVLSPESQYRVLKLFLDMATSYLVFAGRYSPTYREREAALRDLADRKSAQVDAPFPLRVFADRVTACTEAKLGRQPLKNGSEKWLHDAMLFARLLWKWELVRLTGETRQVSESQLMVSWMRRQPLKAKLRGWVSAVRRCGGHRSWPQWLRWLRLGWKASPRYWVYHIAAEVFFQLPVLLRQEHRVGAALHNLAGRLPLAKNEAGEATAAEWRLVAEVTALNYHRLLETTIA
jgi:hypothetical protein